MYTLCTIIDLLPMVHMHMHFKGGSRGVSKVSRNWSDHLWLVFAFISLIMSMLPYSYTFMRWKLVMKVSRSALALGTLCVIYACTTDLEPARDLPILRN